MFCRMWDTSTHSESLQLYSYFSAMFNDCRTLTAQYSVFYACTKEFLFYKWIGNFSIPLQCIISKRSAYCQWEGRKLLDPWLCETYGLECGWIHLQHKEWNSRGRTVNAVEGHILQYWFLWFVSNIYNECSKLNWNLLLIFWEDSHHSTHRMEQQNLNCVFH